MSFPLHKDACHGRNDAISVTNSNSLVHKMRIVKRFNFHHTKAIYSPQTECFPLLKIILKIKDACHGRNNAISVISMTNSNSLVHKMKRFDFHHTKAIYSPQTECFPLLKKLFFKSKMHAMEETMLSV